MSLHSFRTIEEFLQLLYKRHSEATDLRNGYQPGSSDRACQNGRMSVYTEIADILRNSNLGIVYPPEGQVMQTFDQWLITMNGLFVLEFGLSYMDFPDWNWADAFADGLTPEEAIESYKEEMFGEGLY